MHTVPDWDDLRFFLAVADAGSLAGAARTLGVNQSTVFRRIGALEEQLSTRLFDRQARGVSLTEIGEAMLPGVRQIGDDVVALSRTVSGADGDFRGTVRLTTVVELFERIAPWIAEFQTRYPGIELDVGTDQRVYELQRHEADVALRPGKAPVEPDVVGRKLLALPLAAYASPAYLARRGRPDGPDDLHDHAVIRFRRAHDAEQQLVGRGTVALWTDSKPAQGIAARAGLGIAILPRFLGDHDPGLERLFEVGGTDVHLWLLIHADLRRTARVRAFVDFMTDAITANGHAFDGQSRS